MTEGMALITIDALETHIDRSGADVQVVAYYPGFMYVDRMSEWAEGYGQRTELTVEIVGNLRDVACKELTRIVAVGGDSEIEALERDLRPVLSEHVLVMRSLPHFCEILHPEGRQGKRTGVDVRILRDSALGDCRIRQRVQRCSDA